MAEISQEQQEAIGQMRPAYIATCSKDGKPNVSARGSFRVLDKEHVMFADFGSQRTLENLKENPQISAIVLNPGTRKGCRLWGVARIIDKGALFDSIAAELAPRKVKNIVTIKVDEIVMF